MAKTNKHKIGIIGAGRMVERFHLPVLLQNERWQLVALADLDSGRRRWAERIAPGVFVGSDLETILKGQDFEAVLIATPPDLHQPLAARAMAAGLHVLLEKPGGLTSQQAQELVEAAEEWGRVIRVAFNRRFLPCYSQLRGLLDRRAIGLIQSVEFDLSIAPDQWGSVSGYLGLQARGGGVLHDVASHLLDVIPWLFDDEIRAIRCERFERDSTATTTIVSRFKLLSGLEVNVRCSHGSQYREECKILQGDRIHAMYPMGLITLPARWTRFVPLLARMRFGLDRKLTGAGLLTDPFRVATETIWENFADEIAGEVPSRPLLGGHEWLAIHHYRQAIEGSLEVPGRWIDIDLNATP